MSGEAPEGIVLMEIHIVVVLTDDTQIQLEYPDEAPVAEVVGYLEMSKDTVLHPPRV